MSDDPNTLYHTAWLLLHDKQFRQSHKAAGFRPFPKGALQYLVALGLRLDDSLSGPVVRACVEADGANLRRHGAEAPLVVRVFDDLTTAYYIEPESIAIMRDVCGKWLERRALKVGVEEAGAALDKGDTDRAKALLSGAQYRSDDDREEALSLRGNLNFILAGGQFHYKDACPTGLYDLDQAWRGGVRNGDVGIVMGYTGMGKSMWLCMFAARAFWSNRSVLYYTTELTREQIQVRIACGILESGLNDIDSSKSEAELLAAAADRQGRVLGDRSQVDVKYGSIPMSSLEGELEDYREEHEGRYPGLLILDSPIDMPPPGKYDKLYEGLRSSYIMLRRLGRQKGFPVWTSAQTNRDGVAKAKSNLRHIGDAYAMAQKAHYVLGLAQTQEAKEERDGASMATYILKDSLHGQNGAILECHPAFGEGDNGYPGVDVYKTYGLRLPMRKDRDDE